jgi:hypothetical protein
MSALVLLKDKAPTWYDFVLEHTKSVECKSGEPLSFTQTENVMSNLMLGATVDIDWNQGIIGTYYNK